jgi:hypothetical protein
MLSVRLSLQPSFQLLDFSSDFHIDWYEYFTTGGQTNDITFKFPTVSMNTMTDART